MPRRQRSWEAVRNPNRTWDTNHDVIDSISIDISDGKYPTQTISEHEVAATKCHEYCEQQLRYRWRQAPQKRRRILKYVHRSGVEAFPPNNWISDPKI